MKRILLIVMILGALLGTGLVFSLQSDDYTAIASMDESVAGAFVEAEVSDWRQFMRSASAKNDENDSTYDLSSLVILSRVLSYINNNYYEPSRIVPHDMLCAALDQMQRTVAELLIQYNADKTKVTVTVDKDSKTFNIARATRIWDIQYSLSPIMGFIQPRLRTGDPTPKEIEYAAINGLLDTLDPHSSLMSPKMYEELRMSTRGHFGGLGILVGIRDGNLTVITPYEGTPAWRAGIKASDAILEIDSQSTINMALDEAVKLMRGAKGTKVVLKILRKGWKHPRAFTLIRDIIKIRSIASHLYKDNMGYVRLSGFQGNTASDLRQHLTKLIKKTGNKGLSGLILDLRGNPGGLLEQSIQVADQFLSDGVIVSTVGAHNSIREVNRAQPETTVPMSMPIVVLVNGNSASAAEIVSGALKNNNRVIVVGDHTFGKGTVQMLYDFDDGSALKLTIAQYLTPGDISIQNVGISPDIRLLPVFLEKKEIYYFTAGEGKREKDLEKTLENRWQDKRSDAPAYTLKYLWEKQRDEEKEEDIGRFDYVQHDFTIQFSEKLLAAMGSGLDRPQALAKVKGFIGEAKQEQENLVAKDLKTMDVDWSVGENVAGGAVKLDIAIGKDNLLKAGSTTPITVTATNTGTAPLYQVHVLSDSEYYLLDKMEFLLGAIKPGEKRSWTLPLEVPNDALDRSDLVTFKTGDAFDHSFAEKTIVTRLKALPSPKFAYSYELDDSTGGNGDGRLQPGEEITLTAHVKNVGAGAVIKGLSTLRNVDLIRDVFINKGRITFDPIKPGESVSFSFDFSLKPTLKLTEFPLNIMISDSEIREYISDNMILHVQPPVPAKALKGKVARLDPGAIIRAQPDTNAPVIATVSKKVKLDALTRSGSWVRVRTGKDTHGWVEVADVSNGSAPAKLKGVETVYGKRAPRIAIDESGFEQVTDASAIRLKGTALDDNRIQDLYILANSKKALFMANPAKPGEPGYTKMNFDAVIPLEEGVNRIMVVARQNNDFSGSEIIVIYRKPAAESVAPQQGDGKPAGAPEETAPMQKK